MSKEINLIDYDNVTEQHQTNSVFMGINIAAQRCAQLKQGANSRLTDDSVKHKNTVIAVEEVKQGLITFNYVEKFIV